MNVLIIRQWKLYILALGKNLIVVYNSDPMLAP